MLKEYNHIKLADFEANTIDNFANAEADVIRVKLLASSENEFIMQKQGFLFADRTIKVSISVNKCSLDLDKFIRLPIEETKNYKEDIFKIAVDSFLYDRRFHILPQCNREVAAAVLQEWINGLDDVLVCKYKDKVIGFLALKETEHDSLFVHLAAVDAKYRLMGAAMALYAQAIKTAKERGYKKLEGRISSQNMAVMNIYATLGASFSEAQDIFLKEVTK